MTLKDVFLALSSHSFVFSPDIFQIPEHHAGRPFGAGDQGVQAQQRRDGHHSRERPAGKEQEKRKGLLCALLYSCKMLAPTRQAPTHAGFAQWLCSSACVSTRTEHLQGNPFTQRRSARESCYHVQRHSQNVFAQQGSSLFLVRMMCVFSFRALRWVL